MVEPLIVHRMADQKQGQRDYELPHHGTAPVAASSAVGNPAPDLALSPPVVGSGSPWPCYHLPSYDPVFSYGWMAGLPHLIGCPGDLHRLFRCSPAAAGSPI